jgi:energy-coupling factor transport system ATP-binding protein
LEAVAVKGLTYKYWPGGPLVLNGIDFNVSPGEIAAVTGLSGCGKSTLCLCVSGLINYNKGGVMTGELLVNGKDVRYLKTASLAREVGLVFQDPDTQLFSPTVEDEIAFAPENLCLPPGQIRERVDYLLDLLGIAALAEANPYNLSGGEKSLVALAAVLALDPQVLVIDEVMSPLDPDGKKRVASILDKLRAAGKSIIIVEHDLEAVAFADRLMVLNNGKSARFDRTEKVLADWDFLAAAGLIYDDEGLNNG